MMIITSCIPALMYCAHFAHSPHPFFRYHIDNKSMLYDCHRLLGSLYTILYCLRAQQSTVSPRSSGLVRIADSCCGAADCTGHTHTHTQLL